MCSVGHVYCQALCWQIMCAPSSKIMLLRFSLCSHRRALGAAGAAGAVLMLLPQAAQALIKGYEPMTALKGKNYGKERQRSRSCLLQLLLQSASVHLHGNVTVTRVLSLVCLRDDVLAWRPA